MEIFLYFDQKKRTPVFLLVLRDIVTCNTHTQYAYAHTLLCNGSVFEFQISNANLKSGKMCCARMTWPQKSYVTVGNKVHSE